MNTITKISLGIALLALQVPQNSYGKPKKQKAKGIVPTVVLVQLSSESNRLAALEKDGKYPQIDEVKHDAQQVINVTVKDFKDHFTHCPVYFYMDTNRDMIKQRNFNNVLLDTNLKVVAAPPLQPDSKDYLVVFYGRPARQSHYTKVLTDSTAYRYDSGEPFGRGLVASNYKMQQLRYVYWLESPLTVLLVKKGKPRAGYYYFSKHFDIEYCPLAKQLDKELPLVYEK